MRQFASAALVAFVTVVSSQLQVARAAPVTLDWVTVSSTTGQVGYLDDSDAIQTRSSTSAGVVASFVLADASLLSGTSPFTFVNTGQPNPAPQVLSASLNSRELFAVAAMRVNPNPSFVGDSNICSIATRSPFLGTQSCVVSVNLTADTANAGRYDGILAFGFGDVAFVGSGRLGWSGGLSTSPRGLDLGGYWQVRDSGSVPLPGGLALVTLGLVCMLARKSKTN
jgi:hypothetical protein